jgi:diaminopimelate epimerase
MKLEFSKYQGTGNDFILIDDRAGKILLSEKQIKKICDRRFGIGGDGLILLKSLTGFDFEMVYFNADGRLGSMCGNGGRCITAFARESLGMNGGFLFKAADGVHQSGITSEIPLVVKLKMGDVKDVEVHSDYVFLNTGSPHYVLFSDNVSSIDVVSEGRKIRNNDRFRESGTNVNFVQPTATGELIVRTYERGVEDETLSCGTGVIASVLASVQKNMIQQGNGVVAVHAMGGDLKVYFEKEGAGFKNIWLEGEATFVYSGHIDV